MKKAMAFLCVLAMMLSLVNPSVFAAEYDRQASAESGTEETVVLEADASDITINCDTTIDLNGHNLDNVTVTGGTLYCMDSATADYTVADGVYGKVTNVTGSIAAADGYMQIDNSFHRVNLDIYAMTLRSADAGVYYKSWFEADEVVAELVESFGVALSVATTPDASNLERLCGYSTFTGFNAGKNANAAKSSTLLKGIMKAANGDNKNAKNAAMPVYGRAYIKTAEGYIFGEPVKRSLQEQVEAIDATWNTLTESQQATVVTMLNDYAAVMGAWNIPNILGGESGAGNSEIEIPIAVTTENGIVTEAVTISANGVTVTVPAGVKLAAGVTALTLTVTPKDISDTGLTLEENEVLMPMDVHVEGLAADNAAPLTISLGMILPQNLNVGNYTVYHMENGNANEMTLIPSDAAFTAHNQYKYTLDGEVILYVANFSLFAMRANQEGVWEGNRDYSWYNTTDEELYIRNADQLAGFGAIVGGMANSADGVAIEQDDFAGKTVTLLADISIGDLDADNGKIFYPIGYYNSNGNYEKVSGGTVTSNVSGFAGTFDGNGNTISDFYQNTWEMFGDYNSGYSGTPNHYKDAMGLFGYVINGTVKNLNVENFSSDGEYTPTGVIAAYAVNSTFENIAIANCNPRVYNTGNGGIIGIAGRENEAVEAILLKNITVDNSNKITALWGSWDVACGGLVGMYRGNADGSGNATGDTIHFDNCHVSAQIDVYNDVCANYQYYAYRYSGMMIGSVRHNTTDANGREIPNMAGISAYESTVHFGDWNDYYYCELVANTLASYTHDHQMSRLVQIAAIDLETMEITTLNGETQAIPTSGRVNYVVVKAKGPDGKWLHGDGHDFADCYHFVNGVQHLHDTADSDNPDVYETVNGETVLKEDKQVVYREFNNLITGYGWGVSSRGVDDLDGVTILDKNQDGSSVSKFTAAENVREGAYPAEATISLSDLFAADDISIPVVLSTLQVTVSAADEDSTVTGIYTAGGDNWLDGTLKFSGEGAATVTITDYYFCKAFTLNVTVSKYTADLYFESDGKAYCPHCGAKKTWTAKDAAIGTAASGAHYYLTADITHSGDSNFITSPGSSNNACLHLNGKNVTVTSDRAFIMNGGGYLNVMGNGIITKASTNDEYGLVLTNTNASYTNTRLYSGTYVSENTSKPYVMYIRTNGGIMTAYKDVTISNPGNNAIYVGKASLRSASLTLEGVNVDGNIYVESPVKSTSTTATIRSSAGNCYVTLKDTTVTGKMTVINSVTAEGKTQDFTVGGSTVIPQLILSNNAKMILNDLTDGANIKVDTTSLTDPAGALSVVNENASAALPYIFDYDNTKMIYEQDGQLFSRAQTHTDNLVFSNGDNTAYCTVCQEIVEWTKITSGVRDTNVGKLTKGKHYYLSGDTTYTGDKDSFFSAPTATNSNSSTKIGDPACVHLNSYTIEAAQQVFGGSTGMLNVLGSGVVTSKTSNTIYANTIGFGSINLYGGTYTQIAGNNKAVIVIGSNGSSITIHKDVVIEAVNGLAISVDHAGLRTATLTIAGATVNGNIEIDHPYASTTNSYADPDKYPFYKGAGKTEVVFTDAQINGKITANDKNTPENPDQYLHLTVNGATTISQLVLNNNAKVIIGELTEGAEIFVQKDGVFTATCDNAADFLEYFKAFKENFEIAADEAGTALVCQEKAEA